jgi:hypothetical protein
MAILLIQGNDSLAVADALHVAEKQFVPTG